eukprot:6328954-Amphidinium_carterae.1
MPLLRGVAFTQIFASSSRATCLCPDFCISADVNKPLMSAARSQKKIDSNSVPSPAHKYSS